MRLYQVVFLAAVCAAVAAAADPFVGSWKLDVAKSNLGSQSNLQSLERTDELVGPNTHRLVEVSTGLDGQQHRTDGTVVLDGKEHSRSDGTVEMAKRLDEGHIRSTLKRNGRSQTIEAEVSADGKTLSVHTTGTGFTSGKPIDRTEVFNKQ
jgi:hypothetical protein